MFTEKETAYLKSQHLARIATVSEDGQPDVMPVGFEFDGQVFYVGGHNPTHTRKYTNIRAGNARVALVVDDLVSVNPWHPRGVRIYGKAEFVEREGQFGSGVYMRITPRVSWSWSVEKPAFTEGAFAVNKIAHNTSES
jgi:pyridoxamine 5'-phosphate oxidase family protein